MQNSEYDHEGSANYDSDLGFRALKVIFFEKIKQFYFFYI